MFKTQASTLTARRLLMSSTGRGVVRGAAIGAACGLFTMIAFDALYLLPAASEGLFSFAGLVTPLAIATGVGTAVGAVVGLVLGVIIGVAAVTARTADDIPQRAVMVGYGAAVLSAIALYGVGLLFAPVFIWAALRHGQFLERLATRATAPTQQQVDLIQGGNG